jgi:hypothetical protein
MTEPFGALDEAVEEAGTMKKAAFEVALKSKRQIAGGTMAFVFEKPRGLKVKSGQHIRMTLINPPETDRPQEATAQS